MKKKKTNAKIATCMTLRKILNLLNFSFVNCKIKGLDERNTNVPFNIKILVR